VNTSPPNEFQRDHVISINAAPPAAFPVCDNVSTHDASHMPRLYGDLTGDQQAGVAEPAAAAQPAPMSYRYGCSSGHQQHFVVPCCNSLSIYEPAGEPKLILPQRSALKIMPRNSKFN
jgi:hypothetical protein